MVSAVEAVLGDLFLNCQEALSIWIIPEELGHLQRPTPVQVDNSTALGIATVTIKQRKSKAMDMRFYLIRDRSYQDQFNIYWKPGSTNRGGVISQNTFHPPTTQQYAQDICT